MLDLLSSLMSVMDDSMIRDGNFSERLVNVLTDQGDLLLLIQNQTAELDALKRITLNLTSSLELQVVLEAVVKEAMHLVRDAKEAQIYLYQDEKLVFGAALNSDGDKNVQSTESRPGGLTDTVAHEKKTIIIEDIHNHPLYEGVTVNWNGSVIGIPLKMGTRVVGVMNLARTKLGEFGQPDIRLLTMLSEQAAIAIINARLHSKVSQMARIDMLTNLPNRRALDERLDKAIAQSMDTGTPSSVVMMDLDSFKIINDTYGHETGDEVLQQVANLMEHSLRSTDFLARYGGDEMTLVLAETNVSQTLLVTQKIQDSLRNNAILLPDGKTINIEVSGGIAIYPLHAETAPSLIRAADEALYRAKKNSKGKFLIAQNSHL